jgi:hypothetical protein
LSYASNFYFTSFEMIIIGADTGSRENDWYGTPEALSNIKEAGKPVIGLSWGGASFFSHVGGLAIDFENARLDYRNWGEVTMYDATDPIWTRYLDIDREWTENDGWLPITIYDSGTMAPHYIAVYHPANAPVAGVTPIAGQSGAETGHYPVITQTVQDQTYALWGYPDTPSHLSLDGKNLFVNLMVKVMQTLFSSTVDVPTGGDVQVSPVSEMNITFTNVDAGGDLSVTVLDNSHPVEGNFWIVGGRSYNITFSGDYKDPVSICIGYNETDVLTDESSINFRHLTADGVWENITSEINVNNNIICGTTSSFSEFAVVETIPDPFAFTDQTGVALNALITSNPISVTGINAAVPISVIDGEYSINDGPFTSAAGTASNGDSIMVRVMSSDAYSTTVDATLSIGGVIGTFSVTTMQIIDSDGDGIYDVNDSCPNEDATGFDANDDGCIDSLSGLGNIVATLVVEGVISPELENSLLSKVANAGKSATKENICAAVNELGAFMNQINAQRGKKIADGAADLLIDYTTNVISSLLNQLTPGDSC